MPPERVLEARRALGMIQRNITLANRKTTVRLEAATWEALTTIAELENQTITQIINAIDRRRQLNTTLSSSIRVFVLCYFRDILQH